MKNNLENKNGSWDGMGIVHCPVAAYCLGKLDRKSKIKTGKDFKHFFLISVDAKKVATQ